MRACVPARARRGGRGRPPRAALGPPSLVGPAPAAPQHGAAVGGRVGGRWEPGAGPAGRLPLRRRPRPRGAPAARPSCRSRALSACAPAPGGPARRPRGQALLPQPRALRLRPGARGPARRGAHRWHPAGAGQRPPPPARQPSQPADRLRAHPGRRKPPCAVHAFCQPAPSIELMGGGRPSAARPPAVLHLVRLRVARAGSGGMEKAIGRVLSTQ